MPHCAAWHLSIRNNQRVVHSRSCPQPVSQGPWALKSKRPIHSGKGREIANFVSTAAPLDDSCIFGGCIALTQERHDPCRAGGELRPARRMLLHPTMQGGLTPID
jgi:hypothetical protein